MRSIAFLSERESKYYINRVVYCYLKIRVSVACLLKNWQESIQHLFGVKNVSWFILMSLNLTKVRVEVFTTHKKYLPKLNYGTTFAPNIYHKMGEGLSIQKERL